MKINEIQSLLVNCLSGRKIFLKPFVNTRIGKSIIIPKKCSIRAMNDEPLGMTIGGVSSSGKTTPGDANIKGYLTGASKALAALAKDTNAGPNFCPFNGSSIVNFTPYICLRYINHL